VVKVRVRRRRSVEEKEKKVAGTRTTKGEVKGPTVS